MQSILVNDGTICNSKSFCQNNTCVEEDASKPSCQPEKHCSNNGVSLDELNESSIAPVDGLDLHLDGPLPLLSDLERRRLFDLRWKLLP